MNIHPFAAVRPNRGDAALVASVPYDVVDTAEAKAEYLEFEQFMADGPEAPRQNE